MSVRGAGVILLKTSCDPPQDKERSQVHHHTSQAAFLMSPASLALAVHRRCVQSQPRHRLPPAARVVLLAVLAVAGLALPTSGHDPLLVDLDSASDDAAIWVDDSGSLVFRARGSTMVLGSSANLSNASASASPSSSPPTLAMNGVSVSRHASCAAVLDEFGPVDGVYSLRVRGERLDVFCGFHKGQAFTLLASFTQPHGVSVGDALSNSDYIAYFRDAPIWIQGHSMGLPLSQEPVNTTARLVVQSHDWAKFLSLGHEYFLRQRFFKGSGNNKTLEHDVMWRFTYNGFLLQDEAANAPDAVVHGQPSDFQAWVLSSRTVMKDTTGIDWHLPEGKVTRFWLPFSSSIQMDTPVYTACGGFLFNATGCGAHSSTSARRFGNAGIMGDADDGNDPAASWAPHLYKDTPGFDVVSVHQARKKYGVSSAATGPITLQYWIAHA